MNLTLYKFCVASLSLSHPQMFGILHLQVLSLSSLNLTFFSNHMDIEKSSQGALAVTAHSCSSAGTNE
jgi:hypothetical protein